MTSPSPLIDASPQQQQVAAPQQSGFFGRIGRALKAAAPYIQPIADRLAAAFGNSEPLERELQQRRDLLQQQLAQSTMETANLNRQRLSQEVQNYESPAQQRAALLQQTGALEDVRNLHAAPKDIVSPTEGGGAGYVEEAYDPATNARITRPKMMTTQTPNPDLEPYKQAAAGNPPNYVQDWNAGPPPTMPNTVPQQSQVMALPKSSGGPQTEPTKIGSTTGYDHVWYTNGREIGRAPEALAPAPYVGSTTSSTHNTLKQDENGNWVSIPESTSSTKTPQLPNAMPPTRPAVPQTPRATPINDANGNPLHAPLSPAARKTIGQINSSEGIISSILPELDARVKDIQSRGGDANSLWDSVTQRAAWLEYQHGGIVPRNIDPTLARILPVVAQLQIVAAQPYMNNSRNFQFMQQIQQHIPNPEKDSPALMVEKIHAMQQTLPIIRKGIMAAEGLQSPQGNSTNAPSMPSTLPKVPARTADDYLNSLPH